MEHPDNELSATSKRHDICVVQRSTEPPPLLRQSSGPHEVFVYVSDGAFRWIWTSLLLSYAFVGTMLALFAGIYVVFLLSPQSYYYADMFRSISVDAFPLVVLAYASMALLYVWQIVRLVSCSVLRRGLCFSVKTSMAIHPEQSANDLAMPRTTRYVHGARRLYRLLFSSWGILGVRGRFFDTITLLREVAEIAVQIAQAYTCSFSTPDAWTNATFGALLVLNCFASPLLHHYGHASPTGMRRLAVLIVDLVLDVFWSIVLPFSFLAPYAAHVGSQEGVIFQDTFVAKALMELPLIVVMSPGDLAMKLIPTTSLFFTLRKFEFLIQRKSSAVKDREGSQLKQQLSSVSSKLLKSSGLLQHLQAGVRRSTRRLTDGSVVHGRTLRHSTWLQALLIWLMLTAGCVVLVATVLAQLVYDPHCPDGCKLKVHPWFVVDSSRCECAVLEVNCYTRHIDGSASELHEIFVRVEASKLLALIITHCRELHMPPALLRFRNLYSLEVFNSSIRAWPADAAITQQALPRFGYLLLVYTFLSALPEGVYHSSLPVSLREVDIVASNLSTLPEDLHTTWPHVRTLYVDLAQLSEFPRALTKMTQLETLSLRGNSIQEVASDALAPLSLSYLMLSENPLTTLPATTLSTLTQLQIVGTQITSLDAVSAATRPSQGRTKTIFARNSPVCASRMPDPAPSGWRIECALAYTTYRGVACVGYYPLEGKLAERRP